MDNELPLAEYKTLRDEIHVRMQQQQLLIALTVTALGVIGTIAVDSKSYDLLLLVPLITTTFGLMFLEHARAIGALGDYISRELGAEQSQTEALGRWERSTQRARLNIGFKIPLLVLPNVFLFVVCPAVAAIAALRSNDVEGAGDVLAVAGLVLVLLLAALVLKAVRKDIAERRTLSRQK